MIFVFILYYFIRTCRQYYCLLYYAKTICACMIYGDFIQSLHWTSQLAVLYRLKFILIFTKYLLTGNFLLFVFINYYVVRLLPFQKAFVAIARYTCFAQLQLYWVHVLPTNAWIARHVQPLNFGQFRLLDIPYYLPFFTVLGFF